MEVWDFVILVNLRRELIGLKINANGMLKTAGVFGAITLGGLGVASIGCLCLQGMLAPMRAATLKAQFAAKERQMVAEHERAKKVSKSVGYQDGYQIGHDDGYVAGRDATRPVAYDKGYLDALDQKTYLGDSEEILQKLGISLEEHARQIEEAREAAREADWDILEQIFGKKPAQEEPLLKPGTVSPPEPLRPDGDEAVRLAAQGLLDDSDTLGHET